MSPAQSTPLQTLYPWTTTPFISSAPMRLIATAPLATSVTLCGGLGFIGAGSDVTSLSAELTNARSLLAKTTSQSTKTTNPLSTDKNQDQTKTSTLPIGVGFLTWGAPLAAALPILLEHKPCAIWLFAPYDQSHESLAEWTTALQSEPPYAPSIWIQVGSVVEALGACTSCNPDVLVVQGIDAGGHGLQQGASIVSLVPEVMDALNVASEAGKLTKMPAIVAAGGIADGRGVAAAIALGAEGVCMGTRYLAAEEAALAMGYRKEVLKAIDGGQTTVRSKVYDTLRGTTDWPERYGGRGVTNASYHDAMSGMDENENKKMYEEAMKLGDEGWGDRGRMTTYAGTAVGLVRKIQSAKTITDEVREEYLKIVSRLSIIR